MRLGPKGQTLLHENIDISSKRRSIWRSTSAGGSLSLARVHHLHTTFISSTIWMMSISQFVSHPQFSSTFFIIWHQTVETHGDGEPDLLPGDEITLFPRRRMLASSRPPGGTWPEEGKQETSCWRRVK